MTSLQLLKVSFFILPSQTGTPSLTPIDVEFGSLCFDGSTIKAKYSLRNLIIWHSLILNTCSTLLLRLIESIWSLKGEGLKAISLVLQKIFYICHIYKL